nr:IS1634 family transposase [Brevibacterium album]
MLWQAFERVYTYLGFDAVGDEHFKNLVLARIVEPTSKTEAIRVMEDLGITAPSLRTITRTLQRIEANGVRDLVSQACFDYAAATGGLALVLYDVTTLYFEADDEDGLRKAGMSKERKVDPQVTMGLLVDRSGSPLEIQCFEGNKAETKTLVPVVTAFMERHSIDDLVIVADVGMLSAANLLALEDAGQRFIVGSRITKAPYDLADRFEKKGTYFEDGEIAESTRVMGTGAQARSRRIVYQYSFTRAKRDDRNINKMIEKAEKTASGQRPMKKDRFVSLKGKQPSVDWALVERARQLTGIKGYVTNIPLSLMSGHAVVAAYHDLWTVEQSFLISKLDLKARPIFHRTRDSIEAHLAIVFAALAVSRVVQARTGVSIKKFRTRLAPLRSVVLRTGEQRHTIHPVIPDEATEMLQNLPGEGVH